MAYIKTKEECDIIHEGGIILAKVLSELESMAKVGISAYEIDQQAEKLINEAGGSPSFKGYRSSPHDPPFPSTICASINEEIVHGIATKEKILKEGDILSIDIGMKYKGLFTDTSLTVAIGKIPEKTKQLLKATKEALELAIKECVPGKSVFDIGRVISSYAEPLGYGIVRELVGHGVGHEVHESPRVPNYKSEDGKKWRFEPGVVIAIEPMLTMGDYHVKTAVDGWSISTKDGSLSAHFEHTIIITNEEPIVATRRFGEI